MSKPKIIDQSKKIFFFQFILINEPSNNAQK